MSRRDYGAPGTEEEEDLVARSREWMNRNKRDRDWLQSVDNFLETKGKAVRSRSRSRSPRSGSRSRSGSRDRRDRRDSHGSNESDDSCDYRRFLGERSRSANRRDDRHRRRDRRHNDWNTEEEYYNHYDDDDDRRDDRDWVTMDSWEDDDSNANSEYEYRRYGSHLMELTSGEDRFAYRTQQPQKTIVIRGLPQHITEADIRADIINCNIQFRDIRLVRRRDTGASRGFAFVEFYNPEGAQKWIETRQGQLTLKDQSRALMQYSFPGKFVKKPIVQKDWVCRCQAYNFNRRTTCYRCNVSRKQGEVEVEAGCEEVSTFPTNTVLLRGLDALTTEESVLKSIKVLSSLPIRSVRIGRDPVTHASLCICYLEMNSVVDSVSLHNTLRDTELDIDDRRVSVSYAKLSPLSGGSNSKIPGPRMADAALAAAQWSHQSNNDDPAKTIQGGQYTLKDIPRLAEYSASLYATNPQEKAAYLTYYEDYYKKQITEGNSVQLPASGSSAPTVYAAPAVKSNGPLTEPPDGTGNEKYPTPDVSTYQYDKTSGYYYDPHTTLYYDANSQYYFNSKLSKFLYWDAAKSTYLPAPTAHGPKDSRMTPGSGDNEAKQKEDKDDEKKKEVEKDKIKVAKRIAKDMAKWAKTLNHKKEIAKQNIVAAQQAAAAQAKVPGSADIGYAVLERKELSTSALYNTSVDTKREGLVAAYSQGSDSEEEPQQMEEPKSLPEEKLLVDATKKVCLLCKRQFPSLEVLQKHVTMSDLHKQNLAAWYRSKGLDLPDEDSAQKKMQYRDRAKERRLKFGEPETPRPSHLKEQYMKAMESTYEEPTKQGIGSDNLGNKLLQKMGWREGTGLGKSNQGRTDIIQAESRSKSAGLGSKSGSIYTPGPGETYRDCVKKMARMRYNELKD